MVLELYKFTVGYKNWEYCYNKPEIYSYTELIKNDLISIQFLVILIIPLNYVYYFLIIINFLTLIFFIIIPIKITEGNKIYNILIYSPYLISLSIKKIIKNQLYSLKNIKLLFINILTIQQFGFPRIVLNYTYITLKLIKSYNKNPNKKNFKEFFNYLYLLTYQENITKIENFIKYPI